MQRAGQRLLGKSRRFGHVVLVKQRFFLFLRGSRILPALSGLKVGFSIFGVRNLKRKMATNRVAIGPISAMLGAQGAMFLGYILGPLWAPGEAKHGPKEQKSCSHNIWGKLIEIVAIAKVKIENKNISS